jgi:hypothetical protein
VTSRGRTSLLCVAILLAAATAAADTVITAEEVFPCSVVAVDTNFVRIKLPQGGIRVFDTHDVVELRLSDSSRVAHPLQPSQMPPAQDSATPIPPMSAPEDSLPSLATVTDSLLRGVSSETMTEKCRELNSVLRRCGRSDTAIISLLSDVRNEEAALLGIWPQWRRILCAEAIGVPVGCAGFLIGQAVKPMDGYLEYGPGGPGDFVMDCGGGPVGLLLGSLVGAIGGQIASNAWRAALVAQHRGRVNSLVRRVNDAVLGAP